MEDYNLRLNNVKNRLDCLNKEIMWCWKYLNQNEELIIDLNHVKKDKHLVFESKPIKRNNTKII